MEEATPDYAKPIAALLAPAALIYEQIRNPHQSSAHAGELCITPEYAPAFILASGVSWGYVWVAPGQAWEGGKLDN